MRPIFLLRFPAVLMGLVCAASMVGADSGQSQSTGQPGASDPAQSKAQAVSKTSQKKFAPAGVWHHFGEGTTAPPARPGESPGWRAFSASGAAPKAGHAGSADRQQFNAGRVRELEQQMYEMVNRHRSDPANAAETGGRAGILRWNEDLAAVARGHSRDMLTQGFFDHVDKQGKSPGTRINAAGIPWQAYGENIALSNAVTQAEAAFMNEPRFVQNHRANILNAKYTDVGVGIVEGRDGRLYITQDFIESPTVRGPQ